MKTSLYSFGVPLSSPNPGNLYINYTTSCADCIRAGWVWCSNKWNYELPSGDWSGESWTTYATTSEEKGQCCYSANKLVTGDVTDYSQDPKYKNFSALASNTI